MLSNNINCSALARKRVLIAGGGGYIGRRLLAYLRRELPGLKVRAVDLLPDPAAGISACDLSSTAAAAAEIKRFRPEVVFHMAGRISGSQPELLAANVGLTWNLLEALRWNSPSARIVVPGSAAEYGNLRPAELPARERYREAPISPYGISKSLQTQLCRYYAGLGLGVVVPRIFNLISHDIPEKFVVGRVLGQLRAHLKSGAGRLDLKLGDVAAERDFIDVEDVCSALCAVSVHGRRGQVYNVCSGRACSIEGLIRGISARAGAQVRIISEKKRYKADDIKRIYGSNRLLRSHTGWKPRVSLAASFGNAAKALF